MTIDSIGTTGGLAILWNPSSVLLENFFTTRWTISKKYRLIGSNKPRFLTNVYGPTTQGDKLNLIQNMDWLATLTNDRIWILGGEFNMVYNLEEKRGGIHRLEEKSGKFQSLINKICLICLETQNGLFT
jgi:hypothetical protein